MISILLLRLSLWVYGLRRRVHLNGLLGVANENSGCVTSTMRSLFEVVGYVFFVQNVFACSAL